MKLKIVHHNQETRVLVQQPTTEDGKLEIEKHQTNVDPHSHLDPCPISDMIVSGPRKRKPKELIDEVSTIVLTKKRKNKISCNSKNNIKDLSDSKLKQGTPDTGGTLAIKGDDHAQTKTPTMILAEEIQASLGDEQPTFLKTLVRSHVGSCFWMGLPVPFCKMNLPSTDTTVVVEDENGQEFPVKYIAHKTGLSAGWRRFVAGNKLIEGDVLVFQLIGPCRFKVYIVRSHDLNEVDGALSLLILDSQTKQNNADLESKKKRNKKSFPLRIVRRKKLNEAQELPGPNAEKPDKRYRNNSEEVASEVLEGSKYSKSSIRFKNIKSFNEFRIIANGTCIDSEVPDETRRDYYNLCCNRNSSLHDGVRRGLYTKLTAAMIVETVSIARALRDCKITTPKEKFDVWERSLRSFELLGLNVGFLRFRLCRLVSLAYESEGALEMRKYMEEQKDKEEILKLEMKLVELKKMCKKHDCGGDMQDLKNRAERFELEFQEAVDAPW